jgi:hypothetical protein
LAQSTKATEQQPSVEDNNDIFCRHESNSDRRRKIVDNILGEFMQCKQQQQQEKQLLHIPVAIQQQQSKAIIKSTFHTANKTTN